MAKGLLDLLIDSIFDEKWKGARGEKLTERELNLVKLLGRKGKVLRNVYLPKENGETSELDVVFICQKGIIVFESKNYSGWIFGREKDQYWTAALNKREKNRFYNPIKQNRTHLKWLHSFVGEEIPLFSVVVFSERCELKNITVDSEDVKVIKRDRVYATVRDIWDHSPDTLTDTQVEELCEKLKQQTNVDEEIKMTHVQNIREHYCGTGAPEKKPDAETISANESQQEDRADSQETPQEELCPRCGGKLILRTAKKGANAGNQFWGCENFPRCRFVKSCQKPANSRSAGPAGS